MYGSFSISSGLIALVVQVLTLLKLSGSKFTTLSFPLPEGPLIKIARLPFLFPLDKFFVFFLISKI